MKIIHVINWLRDAADIQNDKYIKKYTAYQISYLKKTATNLFIKSPNKPITGP